MEYPFVRRQEGLNGVYANNKGPLGVRPLFTRGTGGSQLVFD